MLAIVAAFKEEIRDYLRRGHFRIIGREGRLRFYLSQETPGVVVVDGAFARKGAQGAARKVIDQYSARAIISPGFTGGARAGLRPGDILICDRLMCVEGPVATWSLETVLEQRVDHTIASEIGHDFDLALQGYIAGTCITLPQLVSASSVKRWVGCTFNADVIDMESFWVSQAAAEHGIPHLVVRSVFDTVEQTLPDFVGETLGQQTLQVLAGAATHVASHPYDLPKLLRLAAQSRIARASLADFLLKLTQPDARVLNLAIDAG